VRLSKPRNAWLWLYVAVNIIAAWMMFDSGELIGDPKGNPLYDVGALWIATSLVVLSYVLILGPLFNALDKIAVRPLNVGVDEPRVATRIGQVLIVLQLGFMAFNVVTGVNIAGSNTVGTDSPLAILWVFVPVDTLFFIYYGLYRDTPYFKPNAAIWLVSNLIRGWAGMYFFILFFEWCRGTRGKKLKLKILLLALVGVLVLYPVLTNVKWLFRLSASGVPLGDLANSLFENSSDIDYFSMIGDGIEHLIGRLQVTSLVVEVMRLRDLLQAKFAMGEFAPFWAEGLHGIIYDRLFVGEKSVSIGVAFTQYGTFDWDTAAVGDWNTNIGYVGWLFIAPHLIPAYLAYTLLLTFLSVYLLKKIGITELGRDMLWLAWLVYLLPPWFAVFTTFIYSLAVFLVIKVAVTRSLRMPGTASLPGTQPSNMPD